MDSLPISIELDGQTFHGLYWVEAGIVTVTTGLATKRAELGHTSADDVARLLLREIADDWRKRSDGAP